MLTKKMRDFANLYALTGEGTQSARDAGYSKHTANVTYAKLLHNKEVLAIIEKERAIIKAKLQITNDEIIGNLARIARDQLVKASDQIQANKVLAQIRGMLRENITNIAVFEGEVKQDKDIHDRLKLTITSEDKVDIPKPSDSKALA